MIHSIKNSLGKYEKVELYFDNDEAGNRGVEIICSETQNAEDCRPLYSNFKDLNEYLNQQTSAVENQSKPRFKR